MSLKYNQQNKRFMNFFFYIWFSVDLSAIYYGPKIKVHVHHWQNSGPKLSNISKNFDTYEPYKHVYFQNNITMLKKASSLLISNLFTVTGFVQVMEHLESHEIPKCYFPDLTNHGLRVGAI